MGEFSVLISEVPTEVKIHIMVLHVMTLCCSLVSTNISEEHSTTIFSIKVTSVLKTEEAYSSEM
jgi:hypothetical protein